MNPTVPPGRIRSGRNRLVVPLLAVLLAGSACVGGSTSGDPVAAHADRAAPGAAVEATGSPGSPADDDADGAAATTAAPEAAPSAASEAAPVADLSALVQALPPAPTGTAALRDRDLAEREGSRPRLLTIADLGIEAAPIIDVGVDPIGDFEVPPADRVGWYRYGPTPGQDGSAILAAHIAYDGQDGVFVRLADVEPGAQIEVEDEGGTVSRYLVRAVQRHDKEALPEDVVFARDGDPRLILVTCGGRFDPARRSYEDNIVVVAEPVV